MTRHRPALLLVLALLLVAASCGGDDGGTFSDGDEPLFKPPRPTSAAEFAALGRTYDARALAAGESPVARLGVDAADVQRYRDTLCNGGNPVVPVKVLAYHDDIPAYSTIFDEVAAHCPASSALDRERGEVASVIADNELHLAELTNPDHGAALRFCTSLEETSDITPSVVAHLASESGLVRGSTATKAIEIGVSILIKACPAVAAAIH